MISNNYVHEHLFFLEHVEIIEMEATSTHGIFNNFLTPLIVADNEV